MTSSSYAPGLASSDTSLPVSVELLEVLQRFNEHVSVIFDDLSRPTHQQQQSTAQQQQQQQQQHNQQQQQQQQQYGQVGQALANAPPSTRALAALSVLDEHMAQLLQRADVHVKNQRRIAELEDELLKYERQWRTEMLQLDTDRVALNELVHKGRKDRDNIERAERAGIKLSTILSYARLLAPYTSAPPTHNDGASQAPTSQGAALPLGAILPYPTEEVMRRGRLAFAEVADIGETTQLTGGKPPSPPASFVEPKQEASDKPVRPVPARRPVPRVPQPQEEEDFGFDLDLNPDL